MRNFCEKCGEKIPESGICICEAPAEEVEAASGSAAESASEKLTESASEQLAEAVIETSATATEENKTKEQFNEYKQKASSLLSSVGGFLKAFAKQPATVMQNAELKLPETIFFAAIGFLTMIIFASVMVGRVLAAMPMGLGSYVEVPWLSMFFQMFLYYIIGLAAIIALFAAFGKLIGKAAVNFKELFTLIIIANIPTSVALLLGSVMAFILPGLGLMVFVAGYYASVFLHPLVAKSAFKTDSNKALFITMATFAIVYGIMMITSWNSLQDAFMGALMLF